MERDNEFMRRAFQLALKGYGSVSPNPMVGAVVVKNDTVVGEGYHLGPGCPHAEVVALEQAGASARGATLYVNLEPCCHFGRTPPCVDRVISAGIKRVVCGMVDPNPLVSGKGILKLKEAGIQVEISGLEREALDLNEVFVHYIKSKKPFVTCKYAMTLDGKICTETGDARWISGPGARKKVHHLRKGAGAVMTGIGTVIADNPRLTCRLEEPVIKQPLRIIVDSTLKIPEESQVLSESPHLTVLATTENSPVFRREHLEKLGAEVLVLPSNDEGRVDLAELLKVLGRRGISHVLLEGGSGIVSAMFSQKLIDKFIVFVAPKLVGGVGAPGPIGGKGIAKMAEAVTLRDVSIEEVDGDVMITGYMP
jgi:diaminohydroxyphosphoribosylaminopyrimidine deaminase/5-amino-6-(5-phosphoribosylamino)uracil reductase